MITVMEEGRGEPVPVDAPGLAAYEVYASLDQPGLVVVVSHWADGASPVPLLPGARSWRFQQVPVQ